MMRRARKDKRWSQGRRFSLLSYLASLAALLLFWGSADAAEKIIDIDKGLVELELVDLPDTEITYTISRTGRCSCQIREVGNHLKIFHGTLCPASNRVKIYIPTNLADDLQINLGVGKIMLQRAKPWEMFNHIVAQTEQGTIVAHENEELISPQGKEGKLLERVGRSDKVNLSLMVQNGMINF